MTAPHTTRSGVRTFLDGHVLPRHLIWGFVGLLLFMIGDEVEAD